MGPGGGQISRVVHVSTRAAFGVLAEKHGFVQEGHTFLEKRGERREERREKRGEKREEREERREKREEARPDHRFLVLFTDVLCTCSNICKSRHEPIGVRGFLRVLGRFFKDFGPS